jgi:hydrogenase maturation factor
VFIVFTWTKKSSIAILVAMTDSSAVLAEGKLPAERLKQLLSLTTRSSPDIIVAAEVGEDAAVVRGSDQLIITADPITFTEENIGYYTVAVNCNDIVAMGGKPKYLMTTILLPLGTRERRLQTIFMELEEASRTAGLLWVGGHTEVTSTVNRVVISAQAIGFLKGKPTRTSDAHPGEQLVMSKWAALEATTLIAREKPEISTELLGEQSYRSVLNWLYDPGISILKEGEILRGLSLAAAHDPTEGGIATGIYEIAGQSGVGVRLFRERLPIRRETEILCGHFGLEPLGALSSGVFLFTATPKQAEKACDLLMRGSIPAAVIGEITDEQGSVELIDGDQSRPLPLFSRDEIIKLP